MSARNRTCSSETPSGTTWTEVSAYGTRADSACTPWIRWPKIQPIPPTASQCAAIPSLHGPQRPHEVIAGTSTRSPFFSEDTAAPVSTTVPTASCPRMRPSVTAGTSPLRMCRSVPQIVVVSTLTITSVGSWMPGSSTVSQDRSPGPPNTNAFMSLPPVDGHGDVTTRALPRRFRAPCETVQQQLDHRTIGCRERAFEPARIHVDRDGAPGRPRRHPMHELDRPDAPGPRLARTLARDPRRDRDDAEQPRCADGSRPDLGRAQAPGPADVGRPLVPELWTREQRPGRARRCLGIRGPGTHTFQLRASSCERIATAARMQGVLQPRAGLSRT